MGRKSSSHNDRNTLLELKEKIKQDLKDPNLKTVERLDLFDAIQHINRRMERLDKSL